MPGAYAIWRKKVTIQRQQHGMEISRCDGVLQYDLMRTRKAPTLCSFSFQLDDICARSALHQLFTGFLGRARQGMRKILEQVAISLPVWAFVGTITSPVTLTKRISGRVTAGRGAWRTFFGLP
jgi:hypothetical protein